MSTDVALRAMRPEDLPAVLALEQALFGAQAWSEAMLQAELDDTANRWYVLVEDAGHLAAYAGLAVLGDEAHVMTIGTAPGRQRQGIGRALLRALLAEARRREVRQTVLEVRVDNAAAIALYESEGFVQVAIRKRYYQPEDVDAAVMIHA